MYCVIYAMFLLTDFRDVFNKTRGVEFNSVKFDQIKIFLPQIGKENYFSNFGKTKRFLAKFGKEEKLYPKIGKKSVKEKPPPFRQEPYCPRCRNFYTLDLTCYPNTFFRLIA